MTEKETGNDEAKTETAAEDAADVSELESDIIRQIEFYFGDLNIVRDKFLREQIKLDDGWVPLDVMIKFKRLAKLTTDFDVICNALNKSTSGLLEVSEDKKKIRRHPDVPIPEMNEERRKELMSRTVYAKGFPKNVTLDDLLKFFQKYATREETENLIMRRYQDRKTKERLFKGSVFVTFKTKEHAQKFLDDKGVKYEETELLTLWQEEYIKKKQEEINERREKKEKKNKDKADNAKEEAKEQFKLPTGTVLHFTQDSDSLKRENIHETLTKLGAEIAFIDFKAGDKEGWVRLSKENQAKEIAEKITDGKLKIGETEVTFKLLEGDEEKQHLDKTVEEMVKRRKNQKNFKGNKRFGKGSGKQHYGNRKRKQNDNGDGPPTKVKADS